MVRANQIDTFTKAHIKKNFKISKDLEKKNSH